MFEANKFMLKFLVIMESAKWRAQRAHVPSVLYVPYVPMRLTCPTCPRAHVPKYILQTGKLTISVLMKSNEVSFTDVFKGAEF